MTLALKLCGLREIALCMLALIVLILFVFNSGDCEPTIIVITPTYRRPERIADLLRVAQTLSHVRNLHWIVVEDADHIKKHVEMILQRSNLPYTYLHVVTPIKFPNKGEEQRNVALQYLKEHHKDFGKDAVVYFADDDNAYDVRLFDNYIRKVKTIGIWAVGLSSDVLVEAPQVENGTITGWDVIYGKNRQFGIDMAGFAVNLELILSNCAHFRKKCRGHPETCFLEQLKVPFWKAQPFGYDDEPKEILAWHVKTQRIAT